MWELTDKSKNDFRAFSKCCLEKNDENIGNIGIFNRFIGIIGI